MNFKNRIIGSGNEDPHALLPNPKNFRKHPKGQNAALMGALQEVGWIQQVIVNKASGMLVDGHLRAEIAKENNETSIPVLYVDLTPDEESMALATIDPIAAMANTDKVKLEALLNSIGTSNDAIKDFIADLAKREGVTLAGQPLPNDPGPGENKAEELQKKWKTAVGQIWILGKHRIACGSCTDAVIVDKLMEKNKAVCMWTDPPYGVDYAKKNASLNRADKGRRSEDEIENDGAAGLPALLSGSFSVADTILIEGAPIYVAHPSGDKQILFDTAFHAIKNWHHHETLIWVKNTMVLGHCDYHHQAEPILFGSKGNAPAWYAESDAKYHNEHEPIIYGWKGKKRFWYAGRDQVSVFAIDRPMKNGDHPTMKPPELVEACLRNSTRRDDIVYEPFSGSGTTLIACERLKRKCRAVELSPGYVAVAIERWQVMTGKKPVLSED